MTPGATEANARCIVTCWASGVQNYAARVWGGLVRDYYREWRRREFDALRRGSTFDADRFMMDYCANRVGVSPFTPSADPVADARQWLKTAVDEPLPGVGTQPFHPVEPLAKP